MKATKDHNHRPVKTMLGHEWKLLEHFLTQGPGRPLLLLWTIGTSLFLFVLGSPAFAVAWTGTVGTLGFLAIITYRRNPRVREKLLESYIAERIPWHTFSDTALQDTVQKSANVLAELALKVYSLGRAGKARTELDRVLTAAFGLLSLQYDLARKAADLRHGLTLIVADDPAGADLMTEMPSVRDGTVDAVEKEADQGRALVDDIGQRLETLMLRVFQLDK